MSEHLLSICIPTYNPPVALFALLDSLLGSGRRDFGIVVSDDCSTDNSWPRLEALAARDSRLRCARNTSNLGMDGNFARVVELARGRYVWLCGQDDTILTAGLDAVLDFLAARPDVDFLYMNHARRIQSERGERFVPGPSSGDHVCGRGLASFLAHTHAVLPTFLPTYILRRALWAAVDASRYVGTCYCQVGVFIEVSRDMAWCHFAGTHVIGLQPQDGWQTNPKAYARIAFGHYSMVARTVARAPWLDRDTIAALYRKQRRRLVYAFILWRHHRLDVDRVLLDETLRAIAPFPDVARPVALIRRLPRFASALLYHLIDLKRLLRSRLTGA